MYKRHTLLNQPENSLQKMWRYLTFERLMQIINDSALYFSHISALDDLWEGLLTTKTEEKLFKLEYNKYKNAKTANSSVKQYEEWKDSFYVNCWHMNDNESYLMWRVYANKECAIQTNYERLIASFGDDPPEINGCVINYIDYDREDFPIGNVFIPVSYKNLPYKDEKEFRLLYWSLNLPNQNFQAGEDGLSIKVNINMLVESIYINPAGEMHKEKIEELKKAIKNYNLSCDIKHTRIKEKKGYNEALSVGRQKAAPLKSGLQISAMNQTSILIHRRLCSWQDVTTSSFLFFLYSLSDFSILCINLIPMY